MINATVLIQAGLVVLGLIGIQLQLMSFYGKLESRIGKLEAKMESKKDKNGGDTK